jgi:hypothetical protein
VGVRQAERIVEHFAGLRDDESKPAGALPSGGVQSSDLQSSPAIEAGIEPALEPGIEHDADPGALIRSR